MKGYTGKINAVDLSRFAWQEEALPDEVKEGIIRSKFLPGFPALLPVPVNGEPVTHSHILKDGNILVIIFPFSGDERRRGRPRRLTIL